MQDARQRWWSRSGCRLGNELLRRRLLLLVFDSGCGSSDFFLRPPSSAFSSPLLCFPSSWRRRLGKGKIPPSLGFAAADWGLYRRALGLGLVLTAVRTPRIALRMAVRGRGYVVGIGRTPRLGLGRGAGVSVPGRSWLARCRRWRQRSRRRRCRMWATRVKVRRDVDGPRGSERAALPVEPTGADRRGLVGHPCDRAVASARGGVSGVASRRGGEEEQGKGAD